MTPNENNETLPDDIAPDLTVIKHVVNKAGSTGQASDFTMHVTGNAITPAVFAGAEAPGITKTLSAGAYDVSETGAATADYTQSKSADCVPFTFRPGTAFSLPRAASPAPAASFPSRTPIGRTAGTTFAAVRRR